MKTKLLTILLCVFPALIAAQNYEKEGDDLYAQSNYELAIKKYNAAQAVAGESASVSQKIAKAKKCGALLNQARLAEQRAVQSNSATDYDKASQLYASLYAEHASPAYKSKSVAMKQKAESIRSQVRAEEERVRIEQQRQQQAEQDRLQKGREERLVRIMNMIPKDGTKQWIYDKRKLVHEYYMDKNSEGAYVDGHNFVCELLLTNDNVYSIELFVRNSTVEELKKLLSNKEIWGNLNGKYVGNRYVIESFTESVSDEKLAECIKRTINKMKQARRALQLKTPVDLGLSVKWAPCNVGAENPWYYGDYFAWGETVPYGKSDRSNAHNYKYKSYYVKTYYDWATYKWCDGTSDQTLTKYNTRSDYGSVVDKKTVLDLEDDAAHVNMGGSWRMPTHAELEELINNCYWEWTSSYNGKRVAGYIVYKVKDASDKGKKKYEGGTATTMDSYSLSDTHIFLPVTGERKGSDLSSSSFYGSYWSSSLSFNPSKAWALNFFRGCVFTNLELRCLGRSVRGVVE